MKRKQLIILVAVMVLGLSGCKKKEPIETQPSIESITPTESEQELSSEDILSDEIETFSFEEGKQEVILDDDGQTLSSEEIASMEESDAKEIESMIEKQGAGADSYTVANAENKTPEEIANEIEESLEESIAQQREIETPVYSDEEMVKIADNIDSVVQQQTLDMQRLYIRNLITEKQEQGIHDFDNITDEMLASYTEEQLDELENSLY